MARIYTYDVVSISDVNWKAMMIEWIYRVSGKRGWRGARLTLQRTIGMNGTYRVQRPMRIRPRIVIREVLQIPSALYCEK